MMVGQTAMRTAAYGSTGVTAFGLDRSTVPAIVLTALLTTSTPLMAASHRYEDTALRSRPSVILGEGPESVKRIHQLASYEAGWDGVDTIGPTVETVKQAMAFARQFSRLSGLAQPHVSLAGDGEINFYWKTPHLVLDLGFTGTGRYSYFGTTPDGVEFIEDDAEPGQPLPPALIAALHA
jgi:hypothetical protein